MGPGWCKIFGYGSGVLQNIWEWVCRIAKFLGWVRRVANLGMGPAGCNISGMGLACCMALAGCMGPACCRSD